MQDKPSPTGRTTSSQPNTQTTAPHTDDAQELIAAFRPPTIDKHVESVRAKLLARSQAGMLKYGTNLERKDLTRLQWLIHAQEEAMDLANYLEVLIQDERTRDVAHVINQMTKGALSE